MQSTLLSHEGGVWIAHKACGQKIVQTLTKLKSAVSTSAPHSRSPVPVCTDEKSSVGFELWTRSCIRDCDKVGWRWLWPRTGGL